MPKYEYKVVPAPAKGKKAKGVRGTEARFAFALEELMNQMGAEGWEYQRAETLPSEERHGLTSITTTYRNMLVFRRLRQGEVEVFEPRQLPPPADTQPEPVADPDDTPAGFFAIVGDNGVEDAEDLSSPTATLLIERAARLKAVSDYEDEDVVDDGSDVVQDKTA
ncbi:MAG: DUF4177 domain-containing protein [Thalassovita sp.]